MGRNRGRAKHQRREKALDAQQRLSSVITDARAVIACLYHNIIVIGFVETAPNY